MQFNIMKVTPALAKEWMRLNPRNRNLNDKLVNDYARQMKAGEWRLNGEAVKRATDYTLLDGQHRLQALVVADVTVELLVIEGLDPETQDTMDTGRKRSTADVLSIHGEANATVLGAVARRAWMWDRGAVRFPTSPNPSVTEVRAILEKYPHLRRSAEIGARTSMSFRPSRAAVTGTAHHIFTLKDQSLTAEFFAQLASGADLPPGHPVLALRNRIIQDKLTSKNVPFHLGVALYIRAWNGLREGRSMQKLQHTAEEPMILPI